MAAKKSEEMVVLRELVALHDMPYDPYARGGVARGFQTRQNRAWDAARRLVVESDGATVPQPAPDVQTALVKALSIIGRGDVKAAVAFLLARKVELPRVPWTATAEYLDGKAYEHVGSYEEDARYTDPAREALFAAVAEAALGRKP